MIQSRLPKWPDVVVVPIGTEPQRSDPATHRLLARSMEPLPPDMPLRELPVPPVDLLAGAIEKDDAHVRHG